jgi:YVTN family beta-propeller protein
MNSTYAGWPSSAAMFRPGRILQLSSNSTAAAVIDITGSQPVVTGTQAMASRRQWVSATVLADGRVLATGGSAVDNQLTGVNTTAAVWNPANGQWTIGPSGSRARLYHSGALLLPDASVLVVGGGAPGPLNNLHGEIYYPSYLYNAAGNFAARTSITFAPDTIYSGQSFSLGVDNPNVSRVTMVKTGSVTHSVNMDQRFVEMAFTNSSGTLFIQPPANANDLPPGYYLLFVFDSQGVPSRAKIVRMSLDAEDETPPTQPTGLTATALDSSSIDLDWNASTDNVAVVGYHIYRDGVQIASTASTSHTDAGLAASTTYNYTVVAYDAASNQSTPSAPAAATTGSSGGSTNHGSQDIGVVGIPGSTAHSGVVYTISGSGADIYGSADGMQYAWWLLSGDITITARIATQQKTHVWAKAGVMLREDLAPGSRNAAVLATPSRGIWFQYRAATNGSTATPVGDATKAAPYWLRLVRVGDTVTGYISPDGVTWTQLGQITLNGLPSAVYVGLPVSSHNNTQLSTATFDNVSVVTSGSGSNSPPSVTSPGDQGGTVGTPVNLAIQASDADGDTLTYAATGLPPGLSIAAATGVISGTPTAPGINSVVVSVSDDDTTTTASFTWTIQDADPLALDPMPSQPPQLVGAQVTYTATSHNGINPQYRWYFDDGSETGWSASPSVTHAFSQPSIYWVAVTVKDDRGQEVTQTFTQLIHLPLTVDAPVSSGSIRNAGNRLWVVNEDNDSVTAFDVVPDADNGNVATTRLAEIAVGRAPRALSIASNGEVWVTNLLGASISVIDPSGLSVARTISLPAGSRPYGVVHAPDGSAAYVVLEALGRVLKLDPASGGQIAAANVGGNLRHLSMTADGARLLVSRFVTPPLPGEATATVVTNPGGQEQGGEVIAIDPATMGVTGTIVLRHSNDADFENSGSGVPNYVGAAVISPDGSSAWVPSKKDNIKRGTLRSGANLNHQNTVRAISSRIDMGSLSETPTARVDHDNASMASAAAFGRYGVFLFVALETSREVAVVDAHNFAEFFRINVGRAPHGLDVSADGKRLFVHNFMDRTVDVFNLRPLVETGQWSAPLLATLQNVATEALSPTVLQGKQFFYDARDTRLAREGYMSCASCHNDGGQDGRVWDLTGLGEGVRNTISLAGRAGTQGVQGRLHWTANFDEMQDFEGQIRALAGGTGLMSDEDFAAGTRSQPLGDPKAGVSADLDALAAYVGSLGEFGASPYRDVDGSLTTAGAAGKAVFNSQGCVSCHGGVGFSDSGTGQLHDIGTIQQPTTGNRLGSPVTGLDSPSLRGLWATAPYLHDGSAATLQDAVLAHDGISIDPGDLDALAAYLLQIDDSEPAPSGGDETPPSQPTGLTANATSSSSIDLAWDAATDNVGVLGYRVFRDGVEIATTAGTAYTDTGLTVATSYSYAVAAYDAAGNQSVPSDPASATTPDTTAPTPPSGLDATATGADSIDLNWSESTDDVGVTGYRVFRDGVEIGTTAATTYADSGLDAGTTYSYTVAAYDAAGNESAQSDSASATTLDTEAPTRPTGLAATATDWDAVSLSWDAATDDVGVTGYRVFRDGVEVGTATGTTYADSGLTAETTYSYTVSAYDAAGNESAQSDAANATTPEGDPSSGPFVNQDIGSVGIAGNSSRNGDVFAIQGSGADIYGNADAFQFAWWALDDNATITVRIVSQVKTHNWAKAGLMVREGLTAGSRYAAVLATPTRGIVFQHRAAQNGVSFTTVGDLSQKAPYWLRLVRQGDTIAGFNSPDGVTWAFLGQFTLGGLPGSVHVGLAVSSHNNGALSTAVFDNLSIALAPPGP